MFSGMLHTLYHIRVSCDELCYPAVSQVSMDEDGCEDEMEWLMEEVETPVQTPHENGHITTKPVSADALRSFSLDEQDSEEEVLTIPGVRVHSGGVSASSSHLLKKNESDEDLVGLLDDTARKSRSKPSSRHLKSRETLRTATRTSLKSEDFFHELLNVPLNSLWSFS